MFTISKGVSMQDIYIYIYIWIVKNISFFRYSAAYIYIIYMKGQSVNRVSPKGCLLISSFNIPFRGEEYYIAAKSLITQTTAYYEKI